MRGSLMDLRRFLRQALMKQKETLSYNLAALKFIHRQQESALTATLYEENTDEEVIRAKIEDIKGGKRKRVKI